MSGLRSAVAELVLEDLSGVSDGVLGDDLLELRAEIDALEGEWLRRVGEFDARNAHEADGALSARAWLRHRAGMSAEVASRSVRSARALRKMPLTVAALQNGSIGPDRVRLLADARQRHPGVLARDEEVLVDAACVLPFADFRKVVAYWRRAADDAEAAVDCEAMHRRRRLHISQTWAGMVRIDGDLDPEGGEIVMTALRSLTEPSLRDRSDERNPAQIRADAIVDLCRDHLDHGSVPNTGTERPHVVVTVDLAALHGNAGVRCEFDELGPISPETARRMACDAGVSRVLMNGQSEPLDIGRKTRVVPPSIRRALVLRDAGCVAEGCDRPHRWCDAHHIRHWIDGGPTNLANLVLLCRRHHRMLHEGSIRLERPPP